MKCEAIAVTTSDEGRRGEQAAGPAGPERPQPQPPGGDQLAEDQAGDEVARQHEEHVDADEAAVDAEQAGVEEDDGDDGERRAGPRCRVGTPGRGGGRASGGWRRGVGRRRPAPAGRQRRRLLAAQRTAGWASGIASALVARTVLRRRARRGGPDTPQASAATAARWRVVERFVGGDGGDVGAHLVGRRGAEQHAWPGAGGRGRRRRRGGRSARPTRRPARRAARRAALPRAATGEVVVGRPTGAARRRTCRSACRRRGRRRRRARSRRGRARRALGVGGLAVVGEAARHLGGDGVRRAGGVADVEGRGEALARPHAGAPRPGPSRVDAARRPARRRSRRAAPSARAMA